MEHIMSYVATNQSQVDDLQNRIEVLESTIDQLLSLVLYQENLDISKDDIEEILKTFRQ